MMKYKSGIIAMVAALPAVTEMNVYISFASGVLGLVYIVIKLYKEFKSA